MAKHSGRPDRSFGLLLASLLLVLCVNRASSANLPTASSQQVEDWKRLDSLSSTIKQLDPIQFYNYSLVCGGKEYDSRVTSGSVDVTIPRDQVQFVRSTYLSPAERAQKCPHWSNSAGAGFGALEKLSIDENTPIGTKVFTLLAEDPELQPIYYFIRNVESDTAASPVIFRIETKKQANNWVGEVIVNAKIDYEQKSSYQYLTYAYDGFNLIERYSTIDILDVDDEPTQIETQTNPNYNSSSDRFVFIVPENASIGSIINPNAPIIFKDVDTLTAQLKVKLVENGSLGVPFTINTEGYIKLIVNVDYETRDNYLLRVIAEDRSGSRVEKDIEIRITDVPDLAPEFLHPSVPSVENDQDMPTTGEFLTYKIDLITQFFENKVGPVFNISAMSRNQDPLANITYELLPLGRTTSMDVLQSHFKIKYYENETMPEPYVFAYLDCVKPFSLNDKEELDIAFVLRASEADLYTDRRVLLRIINGDLCAPTFDKPVYEFFVVENIKELLEPIYVNDCDNGINGKMFLSTTNPDFHSKLDEVYRNAKLGIEMKRSYNYEELMKDNGSARIEFDLIVKSSPSSLKHYEAKAHVVVNIQDFNEFVPRFVKPASTHVKKNGDPVDQKTFFYNAPENKDFTLSVLAEDSDHIGLGQLEYTAKFVDESNNLQLIHNYSRDTNEFNITIPGRYISTDSRVPIIFIVQVADAGETRLTNEIIIYVKPYSDTLKPIYFEFDKYEYPLSETSKQIPFSVKLINDNTQLNRSSIQFEEISDSLNLFTPNLEDPFITQEDLVDTALVETSSTGSEALFENELRISLITNRKHLSMDELFVENNFSDTYEYKLRAWLTERPEYNTTVSVVVKFVDSNQHVPHIRNLDKLGQQDNQTVVIEATISEEYLLTSQMINIGGDFSLLEYTDLDFSDKYGLESLHFALNDTRFFVENKYSLTSSSRNKTESYVSPLIKTVSRNGDGTSEPVFVRLTEPVIWLNLTCEDNYFGRKVNPSEPSHSLSVVIKVTIQESRQALLADPSLEAVEISIRENFEGVAGSLTNMSESMINYTLFDAQTKEQVAYLLEHFTIENNTLRVVKAFNFEKDQHKFEFYVVSSQKDRLKVKIMIEDENDQVPSFVQTEYKFYVKQREMNNNSSCGKLYAIDLDSNEQLNFTIVDDESEQPASGIFKLVNMDGFDGLQGLFGTELQLVKDLPTDVISFKLKVVDLAGHSSECNVTVEVLNNQIISGLRWLNETYEAFVNESSPENTTLIQVQAEPIIFDNKTLPEDTNLTIGYMLVNPSGYYKIDEHTGLITCTNKSVDREEIVRNRILEQSFIYAQAYLKLNSTVVGWSSIARIHVEIHNLNDQPPVFLAPLNNSTQIKYQNTSIFTFQAIDLDKEPFEFRLVAQYREFVEDPSIVLPFELDATSGNLTLDLDLIDDMVLFNLINNTDAANDLITVRLDVMAIDSHNNSANCSLYVNIPVSSLLNQIDDDLVIQIESQDDRIKQINDSFYSISELMPPGETLGQLRFYMNASLSNNTDEASNSSEYKLMPVSFLNYTMSATTDDADMFVDMSSKSLRLIRSLDYSLVQEIGLSIRLTSDLTRDLTILVNDTNNHAPKLKLSVEEMTKLGGNLLVASVDDFSPELKRISIQSSSTPRPVANFIPAIPEQGLPSMTIPVHYNTMELDHNTKRLEQFNQDSLISAYEIIDLDVNNQFNVSFDNNTSPEILTHFTVTSNGTHVLFQKLRASGNESNDVSVDSPVRLLNETRYKFGIDLTDGVNSQHYSGELVTVNAQQIQRLLIYKQDNGRFSASLYRFTDSNIEVEVKPSIIIENQFPYDLHLQLVGEESKYFSLVPSVILAGADQGPVQVRLVVKDSLAKNQAELDSSLKFKLRIATNSSQYLNQLLDIIADLDINIRLLSYDGYQPRISMVEPASGVIKLKEGSYQDQKIATVTGKPRGGNDPNRLQYYLIGDNDLLKINPDSGDIYLTGKLDAEQQQLIVFYAFVRDMDYKPLGRNSELIKIEILVTDVNEFEPTISITRPFIELNETSKEIETDDEALEIIKDLTVECLDRDVNSTLNVTLHSVGYVHQYDPNTIVDLELIDDNFKHSLHDLFELQVPDLLTNTTDRKDSSNRASHVTYVTSKLRLEKLYKPWSYLIRIDLSCSDGEYQSRTHLLIRVLDKNNHAPRFVNQTESISRDETQLVEKIYKVQAYDLDSSPQFGNKSIRYNIQSCTHSEAYDVSINRETGEIYSNLRVNLSPEEIVASRKLVVQNNTHQVTSNLNKILCVIEAIDGGNLTGYMNLTINVKNVNSNPPLILSDMENKDNEIELELHEGPQSRGALVTQFVVYDMDGARNVRCAFDNGMSSKDLFIILTEADLHDENIAICTIKVCADCKVEHRVGQSFILLDVIVEDKIPAPVSPNTGIVRKTVRIKVIPNNSNPPMFANGVEEVFYMLDSNRPGTQIGTVFATDLDTYSPDEIHYELYSSINDTKISHLDKFELRKIVSSSRKNVWSSVGLFVKKQLTVDESPYRVVIRAYDTPLNVMTTNTHHAEKVIIVHILNQGSKSVWVSQNGAPIDMYETSIQEERDENEPVLKIKAVIPDMYFNQNQIITDYIEYSILNESTSQINPYYKINKTTGQVYTTGVRLDYEEKNAQLMSQMRNFRVQVVSKDNHFRYATSVRVNLIDINDNAPLFDPFQSLIVNVYENTTRSSKELLTRIKATDADSQENGVIRFSISTEGDFLEIDTETGDLYVLNTTSLDRELTPTLHANLTAYNPDGAQSTSVNLTVVLLDINDNTPLFNNPPNSSFLIDENSLGFTLTLNATDPDNLFNGSVYYYLDTNANTNLTLRSFQIDPILGVLSQAVPIDYETVQRIELVVCASDQGTPSQLKSNMTISINVKDENDNAPEFDSTTPRRASLIESAKPGHNVVQLVAKDIDLSSDYNQTLYRLINEQGLDNMGNYQQVKGIFEIDTESGWIRVGEDAKLDYSIYKEYLIQVQAYDKNKTELTSQVFNLTVYVEPSRDKQPIFEPVGHHLSRRGIRDVNSTVLYARSLDESKANEYVVDVIKAKDPNQYGINYFIDSVEEVFYNKSANVTEMNESGEMVTKNYTSRLNNDLFKIGIDDGILKTNQTRSNYQADFYMIKIRAVSKLNDSLSSIINLVVNLDKESDSLFPKRVYEISVDENLPVDHVILALKPKRLDERRKLRYRINTMSSMDNVDWFKLDYENGLLKTNSSKIDCELVDEVILNIDVNDIGNENNEEVFIENLLVKIKINDLNDNQPQWDLSYDYTVSINEDTNETIQNGRFITKFKATDLDRTEYNSLTDYEIVGVRNGQLGWFKLESNSNEKTSNLYKTSGVEMDREKSSHIIVRVRAFNVNDKSKYVERDVVINLIDLNDNTPVIANQVTLFTLDEDYSLFKVFGNVSAYDLDEPNTPNSILVYQIVNSSSDDLPITINPSNGQLSLNKSLNYDRGQREFNMTVLVSDTSSTQPLTAQQTFTIKVLNINNNQPVFTNLPSDGDETKCVIKLYESETINQDFFTFTAFDLDQETQQFEFNLSQVRTFNRSTNDYLTLKSHPFDLSSSSLKLSSHLDRESIDNYLLSVTVFDQAINNVILNSSTECLVQVLDVNDNKPEFVRAKETSDYVILPLVNERTQIGWFGAVDADLGSNSTLVYSLAENYHNLFEIDPESSYVYINLRGKQVFLNTTYDLEVVVRDQGNMVQLENKRRARVIIDDNYFKFKQSDNDNLKLNVANLVSIEENTPNDTFVARVNVVNSIESVLQLKGDEDNENNKTLELSYKLLTCNDTFKIDNKTGEVRVLDSSKLDYEEVKEFVVQIECTEVNRLHAGQVKYRQGRINMLVKLENLNDNPVSFDRSVYSYTIDENAFSLPQPVTGPLVQITDPDLSLVDSGSEIAMQLEGDDSINNFRIVRLARLVYRIEATHAFDYELKTRYEFKIVANDGLHVTRVPCSIDVNDLNDNEPVFESSEYTFNVDENSPIGTQIGQVRAIDLDRTLYNNQTLYRFYSHEDEDLFSLDRVTGIITVIDSKKLDREVKDKYNVTVIAYNANDMTKQDITHVIIKLNDVNDQTPTFDKAIYQIYLREKLNDLPHLILNLTAKDGDLGENGTIVYELAQPSELFSLDARTGKLYLIAYLDADSPSAQRSFSLHVRARDEGKSKSLNSECTVQINLIDINDHAPEFKQPLQSTFYFDENDQSLVSRDALFTVVCQDPDASKSEIEYSIHFDSADDQVNSIFSIQKYKETGRVKISKPFDYETAKEYRFRVKCVDKGVMIDLNNLQVSYPSSQTTEMEFVVRVNDLDDNEPLFNNFDLDMNKNVSETLSPESLVTILPIPNDIDSWAENKIIRYKILSGNEENTFRLNDTTGEIFLANELDTRRQSKYKLVIKASSRANWHLSKDEQDHSVLNLHLRVVADKLLIEFTQSRYFIDFNLLQDQDPTYAHKNRSLFYSRAHMINRKPRNPLRYRVASVEVSKLNSMQQVPKQIVDKVIQVDQMDGRLFINATQLEANGFVLGDSIIINLIANLYAKTGGSETSQLSESNIIENSLTRLVVNLTDEHNSILMGIHGVEMRDMFLSYLNPMSKEYIERKFGSMGVRSMVQDLIVDDKKNLNYSILMQVTSRGISAQDQPTLNLELDTFMAFLKNNSMRIDNFLDQDTVSLKNSAVKSSLKMPDNSDTEWFSSPFYSSWLFWLLFVICLLLIVILIMIVFCIKLAKKQTKCAKKLDNLLIDYPPGVNPMYDDGFDFKTKSGRLGSNSRVLPVDVRYTSDYEDQELEMKIDEDDEH